MLKCAAELSTYLAHSEISLSATTLPNQACFADDNSLSAGNVCEVKLIRDANNLTEQNRALRCVVDFQALAQHGIGLAAT